MTVIAYVTGPPGISTNFDLVETIAFFDDNDPANVNVGPPPQSPPAHILFQESWEFPPTLLGAQLQTALKNKILERGALYVRARAAAADAAALLPTGALVAIPGS